MAFRGQDAQRVFQGLSQIAVEVYKRQAPRARAVASSLGTHAADVVSSAPGGERVLQAAERFARASETEPSTAPEAAQQPPSRNASNSSDEEPFPWAGGGVEDLTSTPPPSLKQEEGRGEQQPKHAASSVGAAAVPASIPAPSSMPPLEQRRPKSFREAAVPQTQLGRAFGFAGIAARVALSGITGYGSAGGRSASASQQDQAHEQQQSTSGLVNNASVDALVEGLCRMRGAALKLGQMVSMQDERTLPPYVLEAFERVRQGATTMPERQLNSVLSDELGDEWRRTAFARFDDAPIAAASIGQVHSAAVAASVFGSEGGEQGEGEGKGEGKDAIDYDLYAGETVEVAVKVQYPGVADSIDSDVNNLRRLSQVFPIFPRGLYLDRVLASAKDELRAECDYVREAEAQEKFRAKLVEAGGTRLGLTVPRVAASVSSRRVLTTEFVEGVPLDSVTAENGYTQEVRDRIARRLLWVTCTQLFDWRFMQTDPNWSNFLYRGDRDELALIDFGAAQEYSPDFIAGYLNLVWGAAQGECAEGREMVMSASRDLGFITGDESQAMLDAHYDAALVVGEPFRSHEPYDFSGGDFAARVGKHGETFAKERLTPPPKESYSLHRALSGAFLTCIKLDANIVCRDILEEQWRLGVKRAKERQGGALQR